MSKDGLRYQGRYSVPQILLMTRLELVDTTSLLPLCAELLEPGVRRWQEDVDEGSGRDLGSCGAHRHHCFCHLAWGQPC